MKARFFDATRMLAFIFSIACRDAVGGVGAVGTGVGVGAEEDDVPAS